MSEPYRFAVTTGDPDGIGFEITAKALAKLPQARHVRYHVFGSRHESSRWQKLLCKNKAVTLELRDDAPAVWVREAAEGCMTKKFSGMVTGPMSKNPTGHTEILQQVSGAPRAFMTFLGRHFHVLLATGHIPLARITQELNEAQLAAALTQAVSLHRRLQLTKPIGLLGLNPHAGEDGKIGGEEVWIKKLLNQANFAAVKGPLVPDAAFAYPQRKQYSLFVALYHDQGLIPFKAMHAFKDGTHVTLGIPFVRTSVDHGTAKDIFNKNKADPGSMIAALKWARKLI